MKRFVKWIFYIMAGIFGSELGSRFEEATMTTRIFLDGKEISNLRLEEAAKQFGHPERFTSLTDVNLWDIASFSIPGSWAAFVPVPLFSILCLIVVWRLLSRW